MDKEKNFETSIIYQSFIWEIQPGNIIFPKLKENVSFLHILLTFHKH